MRGAPGVRWWRQSRRPRSARRQQACATDTPCFSTPSSCHQECSALARGTSISARPKLPISDRDRWPAVTGDADRLFRFAARRLRMACVARPQQRHVQLALDHGLDKFANPIAQATFDRIKPVVEKMNSRLACRLLGIRLRGNACHGVVPDDSRLNTPRITPHSIPTNLATASWLMPAGR